MTKLPQDKELFSRLQAGDEFAFRDLYNHYWEEALQTVNKRIMDEEAAKDILQDVFINIWKLKGVLNLKTDFSSYLFGALKLRVIGYFQSEKIKQKVLDKAMQKMEEQESQEGDLNTYYEMEQLVSTEIDLFPETMRLAFLMRSDDRTIKEIASELNLAEQTIKNNLSEATRRIRLKLVSKYPKQSIKYLLVIASLVSEKLMNS